MKKNSRIFARRYAATLQKFLARRQEATLERAYKLGRGAIAAKIGILDLVRIHRQALEELLSSPAAAKKRHQMSKAAETFFLEVLSPFEATHRGFSQMNDWLQERNRELEKEMAERQQAEKALQASESQLRGILEHSPAIIFLKDTRGRYLRVNRQFEKQFGFSQSDVAGKTDRQLFPRKQAARFQMNDRKVLREGHPIEFEETALYSDGPHTSIVSKFPLRGPKGKIRALGGIATDITVRKQAEEELRQSEERFRLLISNVKNYAIYMLSPDGRVASWNTGAERIKGWHENEIIGKSYGQFFTPEEIKNGRPQRELKVALARGRYEGEGWRVRKDGVRFWASVVITPVRAESGRLIGFAKVTRDMTESKEVEAALLQSEEHYRRLFVEAQIMQENLRNLSNKVLYVQEEERKRISRELHDETGQKLTAISVMLAMLKNEGVSESKIFARKIAEIQQLLERTMESIHSFARELRPAMLDELGLIPALRSHMKNFAGRTGLRAQLSANPAAENLTGEQKTALFRVMQESLTNVAKHARASRVNISIRKSGGNLILEITDDGKSFDTGSPSDTSKRKQRLGLLGMQERVRLIGGQFVIEPQPGRGTVVRAIIPFKPISVVTI